METPGIYSNLPDTIAEWLTTQIVEGEYEPGNRISIDGVANVFGVSQTPVREALRLLKAEGLVELPPRRSPRVARHAAKDVRDIYSCRAHLHGLAARLAAPRMTPEHLATLDSIVGEMAQATHEGDVSLYLRLSGQFNDEIAGLSDNGVLIELLGMLRRRTLHLRSLSITAPDRVQAGLEFHRQILAAFDEGNANLAEKLMQQQITRAQDYLLERHFSGINRLGDLPDQRMPHSRNGLAPVD